MSLLASGEELHARNIERLIVQYPGVPAEEIRRVYSEVRAEMERMATVRQFLPILIARTVAARIRDQAQKPPDNPAV